MERTMSDRVGDYADLVADLARRLSSGPNGMCVEAEYADLYQEGLINVWQTLERGITPTADIIKGRMISWKRLMKFQSGRGGHMDTTYATLLPLEDFHQPAGA